MKVESWQYDQRVHLSTEAKVQHSLQIIRHWYEAHNGKVYVAFSGGKDSLVLLHLVRWSYTDVPAVYNDTGMEYPEVARFAKERADVVLKPTKRFPHVVREYGYPVVSKVIAQYIHDIRHSTEKMREKRLYEGPDKQKRRYALPQCWRYLLDAPFGISAHCCAVLKKYPAMRYERAEKRRPFYGMMATDSMQRRLSYLKNGCNVYDTNRPRSWPLAVWTDDDIWTYIRAAKLEYCEIYDMGYERTGCALCLFGVHQEDPPNRFQRLKQTHPKFWAYGMDRLGLRDICEYMDIPYE